MASWLGKQAQVCFSTEAAWLWSAYTVTLRTSDCLRCRLPRAQAVSSLSLTEPPRSQRGTRMPCFNGCLRCLRSVLPGNDFVMRLLLRRGTTPTLSCR